VQPTLQEKEFQVRSTCPVSNRRNPSGFPSLKKPPPIIDMNGIDTFLDINNAHLRVNSGNVQASTFVLDQINIVTSANTATTVNFNNVTKAFNAASNIEVGTANLFVDTTTSKVGIGTDAPAYTLDVRGTANVGALTATTFSGSGAGLTALDATNIASGTLNAARIPDLEAAKITTGTLNAARIPDLEAAKITGGTLNAARIPDLDAAKITGGTLPVSRGGTGTTSSTGSGALVLKDAPAFTGDATFDTDTLKIDATNNRVGIGTASPNTALHVKNETDSSGTGDAYISDKTKKPTECLRLQGKYHSTGSGALLRFTNQHNSGTFPNTGEYNLAGIAGYDHDNSWGGGLVFYTSPGSGTGGDNLTHRMSIDQSGNVGIGTIAPAQQLEVHGNIRAGGNDYLNGYVQMSNNGSVFRNYSGSGAGLHFTGGAVIPADMNGGNHTTAHTLLGTSSYKWGQIYSTSSSISASDRNEKQDINEITESERKVASKIVDLFRTFRMKDAVSKKGDEARLHNGVIAQDLIEVFQSEGLNAHRYGLFCYDDIWLVDGENELYETVYEKDDSEDDGVKEVKVKTGVFADKDTPGAVATPGPYSIRYEELLCFVVSGELQNERIKYSTLEARVAALENV